MNPSQGRKKNIKGCSQKKGGTARVVSVIKKMVT